MIAKSITCLHTAAIRGVYKVTETSNHHVVAISHSLAWDQAISMTQQQESADLVQLLQAVLVRRARKTVKLDCGLRAATRLGLL